MSFMTDMSRLVLVTVLCVLVFPVAGFGAGVSFVPDGTPEVIHPVRPNLSVLTYRVPGGLLVADRLAPGHESRFGEVFTPQFKASEFFLLQGKGHPVNPDEVLPFLETLGVVHWQAGETLLVEIPADHLEDFMRLDVNRSRIPLDSPPSGWDRRMDEPVRPRTLPSAKIGPLIEDYVSNVSGPAFFQTIQEISGHAYFFYNGLKSVSTRYYNTSDKDLVADFLAAKLEGYGYTVTFDPFTQSGHGCRNIVATRVGTVYPDEYVVVGGHYDSISQNPSTLAPGAEDNGSGTAAVMEIARISSGRDFERTVQLVLFDSEEQGLYGSEHFVDDAIGAGRDIVAALTMDMVSYYDSHYSVRIEGEHSWEWLMSIMETKTDDHTDIGNQKDYNSWGSDHVPFQQAGIPAFLAIDYDYGSYPGYHQTDDNWGQISASADIGTQIIKAVAATLAEVAGLQSDLSGVGETPVSRRIDLVAYPNPFNPQVMIAFSPEQETSGEVAVFDVTGRKVAVLAQGRFAKGLNRISWNGQDASGRAVSSGVYLCQMRTPEGVASVEVTLVR
jgi:hypothetical protein